MSRTQSNIQQRKAREAETRREHIFAVVKALIKKGGAREVTIRKVAQEVGFSTTVVYSLFHDKATLITRAMDADLLELVGSMKKSADSGSGPVQRLRLAGYAYVQFGMERPDEYALVFMEPRPHAPVDASEVQHGNVDQDPYAFAFHLLQDVAVGELGYVLQNGTLSEQDAHTVHLMTQIFWQGLHGMVSLGVVMGEDDAWAPFIAPQTNAEALLDVLIAGITQRFRRPGA